jgi:hypothetical protein
MVAPRACLPPDLFDNLPTEPPSGVRLTAKSLSLDEFAERTLPKRKEPHRSIDEVRADAERMREAGDWSGATPRHLVALYETLYRVVYGYRPTELSSAKGWTGPSAAATRLVAQQFGGSMQATIEFMRWAWQREEKREKWRRENRRDGGRLGWRLQFGDSLVDEYRIAQARTR